MNDNLLKTFFKTYPMIYKMVWKENIILSLVDILHGCSFAIVIIITQIFYDSITGFSGENENLNTIIKLGILLITIQILTQILNGFVNFYADVVQEKGYGKICFMMQKKMKKIAPIEYEKSDFLDVISKADKGAEQACAMVDTVNSIFTFYVPYFTLMAIYMYSLNYILILAVLLVFIPVFITNYVKIHYGDVIERKVAPIRREAEAYEKSLVSLECYKETRVLYATNYFIRLYKTSIRSGNKIAWHEKKKEAFINLGLNIFSFIAYGTILVMLVYLTMKGEISIGSFAIVFSSIDVMFYLMDEIFNDSLGNVAKNMGLVNNFLVLMKYPEAASESISLTSNDVSLKNVTFRYPDSKKIILDNISLEIEENETIAVVGKNGAGKTTLSKIIMGLYCPEQGEVIIGGQKLDKTKNVLLHVSAVFQKFNRYKLNLDENIRISDFSEKDSYKNALDKIDTNMNIDPDVILSRDFDGVDLSGGQWQKIAIARGIHKKCEILILDEPTAAIDPIKESALYDDFIKMSENKTSIIITHRLGIARAADRIVVMKDGKIVEIGKHQVLIDKKQEYYKMWSAQANWYQKENAV